MLKSQHGSRRERQVLDILYQRGRATVAEVRAGLDDPPSYSAVRALLRVLEEKGQVRHEAEDLRYVYTPLIPRKRAQKSALAHLVQTFFEGSAASAAAALLDAASGRISDEDLDRLERLIEKARRTVPCSSK